MGNNLFNYVFICFLYFLSVNIYAFELPSIDDIEKIRVQPQDNESSVFYTEESLLESLPNLHRANFDALGFGKVWSWQKGIIYLKNGKKLRWRSFTKNIILFETDDGAVFYTDIISQSNNANTGKITRNIKTEYGEKEIIIDVR
ncbi:MAG: hypothetical protein MI865_08990 [Proteobacteria bacterium]|nr:hypothetical protein [Pseudomonadota bacterium]